MEKDRLYKYGPLRIMGVKKEQLLNNNNTINMTNNIIMCNV